MKNFLPDLKMLLLSLLFLGSVNAYAQDGAGPNPLENCPPATQQVCITVAYPNNTYNDCPLEVCLVATPTPLLNSLCPVAPGPGLQPCETINPGEVKQLCIMAPAGDPNTWYTFDLVVRHPVTAVTAIWRFPFNIPFFGPHKRGGCHTHVFVTSPDGKNFTLQNDLLLGL